MKFKLNSLSSVAMFFYLFFFSSVNAQEKGLDDKINEDDMEDLIRVLCDAVCKNFPTN